MNSKKTLCLLLAFVLFFGGIFFSENSSKVLAATQAELEDKIDEIDGKIEENEKKLDELKDKKESQEEYLKTLEEQKDAVEEKASNLQTQISSIDTEVEKLDTQINQLSKEIKQISSQITKAKKQIKSLQQQIDDTKDFLAQRLRASYMKGSESTLQILMGADSLASFMTRLEMVRRSSEQDKQEIEQFRNAVTELNETKEGLVKDRSSLKEKKAQREENKESLVTKRNQLKKKQNEYNATVANLENKYSQIESYIDELDKSSSAYKNYISKLQSEREAADAEIDRIISEYYATTTKPAATSSSQPGSSNAQSTTASSSGGGYDTSASWAWPLGGASCYISSHYGYRDASIGGNSFHGGTDITGGGIYGKPVYATRGGKVITAVTSYSGYGIYVLIDHGDGFSSLYAHMSARYVSAGDTVSKGQMIGRVGSTGNSTGPHLHFEIRYYGEKKNPMNYVKQP